MSDRLTLSVFLAVLSLALVWAYRPDQSRYERLNPAELRQPMSAQPELDVE